MQSGICYIVGAGDFFEKTMELDPSDLLIAADGGYEKLNKIGIKPSIVIGDFDSLGFCPKAENVITLPCEKDITDVAAAIDKGLEMGYGHFRIFGGTGGRLEHTIANIQNMIKLIKSGNKAEIMDEKRIITAIADGEVEFDESHRGFISVFSHSDTSEGVSETGFKYGLENAVLSNSEPLGVSNEFTGKKAKIKVEKGTLLIIYDRQRR